MRKLIYLLVTMVSLFIIGFFAVFMLLQTENGSRWLVHHVSTYMPGKLTIGNIQGSLLSDLSLYKVDQYVDQYHIQIEHIEFNWQPMALLGKTILIRNLNINGINYIVEESKKKSTRKAIKSLQNITFPFSIAVKKARLDHLNFYQGGTQHSLDYVQLAGRANQNGLFLRQFVAQGEKVHVDLQGHIGFHYPYPFQTNINWSKWFPTRVKAEGKCDIRGDIDFVEFTHKLSKPLVLYTRGQVNIGRNLTTKDKKSLYDLILKGDFIGPGLPLAHIESHTQSDLRTFQIDSLLAHTFNGVIKVNGHLVLQPEPKVELTVNATDIDPGEQWPGWHGKLAFNSEVQAKIDAGTPTVLLHKLQLDGYLLDHPFKALGNLALHGTSLISGDLEIHSGDNSINLSGTTAEHMDVKFDVDARDPFILWPKIKGHLKGNGIIKGTRSYPTGTITIDGNSMSYGDYTVQNIHSDFTFDSNNWEHSTAKIKLVNLRVGDEVLSNFTLNTVGSIRNHHVRIDFVFPSASTDIEFVGNCLGDIWKVDVDKASFSLNQYKIWRLRDPVHLLMSYEEVKPFKACWTHEKSSVCAQGSWNQGSGWKAEGDVNDAPLKVIIDLLSELFKEEHLGWGKMARY